MKKLLCIFIFLILSGCTIRNIDNSYPCQEAMQDILSMTCEDATVLGYASAYFGKEQWGKMLQSYDKDRIESKYGFGCGKYWGHWLGRRIYKEQNKGGE
jgi:hypothetical protein